MSACCSHSGFVTRSIDINLRFWCQISHDGEESVIQPQLVQLEGVELRHGEDGTCTRLGHHRTKLAGSDGQLFDLTRVNVPEL